MCVPIVFLCDLLLFISLKKGRKPCLVWLNSFEFGERGTVCIKKSSGLVFFFPMMLWRVGATELPLDRGYSVSEALSGLWTKLFLLNSWTYIWI